MYLKVSYLGKNNKFDKKQLVKCGCGCMALLKNEDTYIENDTILNQCPICKEIQVIGKTNVVRW